MRVNVLSVCLSLIVLIGMSSNVYSSTGMNYYPKAEMNQILSGSLQDSEIKDLLFEILSTEHLINDDGSQVLARGCDQNQNNCFSHKRLGYKQARSFLFGQIHLEGDASTGYSVKGVYCNKTFKNGHAGRIGPRRIPNSNVLNCEHTWPQSKFQGRHSKSTQKGDLHHLFPTDSRINSMRGNHPFGEVHIEKESYCTGAKYGSNKRDHQNYYFQPPVNHRGNVARAMFYFSVRYQIRISEIQEEYLRRWHLEDPVDSAEVWRNDQVEDIQFNRNPFVDFPHLVSKINNF